MKVRLLKQAEYDFNETKYTAIPMEVFTTLVGDVDEFKGHLMPEVVMFENKDDYIKNASNYILDKNKSVYVSTKGQIFCFLSHLCGEVSSVDTNESANTEESKGE